MTLKAETLRALAEKATPGPWDVTPQGGAIKGEREHVCTSGETVQLSSRIAATHDGNAVQRDADYALITHLRNAVPEILELLEADKDESGKVIEECAAVCDDHARTWGLAMASPAIVLANAIRELKGPSA